MKTTETMSKAELKEMVGKFISEGYDYDECLQTPKPYDAEAEKCANEFFSLCENGIDIHVAFEKAFA